MLYQFVSSTGQWGIMINAIFNGLVRTRRQKALYYWTKMITAVVCGAVAANFTASMFGNGAYIVWIVVFFLSYVTVAPIAGLILCLLEGLAAL